MSAPLLEIRDLTLQIGGKEVLHGVDLSIDAGEAVGVVGESGSGKSLTARSVIRLLPTGAVPGGEIVFDGRSVLELPAPALRSLRGDRVAMIFQDPRAHTNPIHSIGDFLTEGSVKVRGVNRKDAATRAEGLLHAVGITDARRRMNQYPHELSGGLLQRVMIAAALMSDPVLLLADEPTTALDVTTQEEVMAILDELRTDRGLAMLFITHDLDLAAATCDRLAVMNAGRVVETLTAGSVYEEAREDYTRQLMAARPDFRQAVIRPEGTAHVDER